MAHWFPRMLPEFITWYCFHHRSLKSIQTHWSVLHSWHVLVEECGWRSPRDPPFVSFILKHSSFYRKSTSQHDQRCRTLVCTPYSIHIHQYQLKHILHIRCTNIYWNIYVFEVLLILQKQNCKCNGSTPMYDWVLLLRFVFFYGQSCSVGLTLQGWTWINIYFSALWSHNWATGWSLVK